MESSRNQSVICLVTLHIRLWTTLWLNLCGSLPIGQGRTESFLPERKIYLSQMGFFTSPEYRSLNHAGSNVKGLKLKITAHKTFKNKFVQIRSGIKFIYCQNTAVIGSVYSDSQTCNVWMLERVLFFTLQCKQMYFQSRKLTNIFYFGGRFIHSLA